MTDTWFQTICICYVNSLCQVLVHSHEKVLQTPKANSCTVIIMLLYLTLPPPPKKKKKNPKKLYLIPTPHGQDNRIVQMDA